MGCALSTHYTPYAATPPAQPAARPVPGGRGVSPAVSNAEPASRARPAGPRARRAVSSSGTAAASLGHPPPAGRHPALLGPGGPRHPLGRGGAGRRGGGVRRAVRRLQRRVGALVSPHRLPPFRQRPPQPPGAARHGAGVPPVAGGSGASGAHVGPRPGGAAVCRGGARLPGVHEGRRRRGRLRGTRGVRAGVRRRGGRAGRPCGQ